MRTIGLSAGQILLVIVVGALIGAPSALSGGFLQAAALVLGSICGLFILVRAFNKARASPDVADDDTN